jgi:hypothetical protein
MWPVAIFLLLVVGFYWFAFMGTIWFCFNGLMALWAGHFIRVSIWFSLGIGMILWWEGSDVIPDPWDFDKWLKGSAWVVGLGALATFVRWRKKQQATQTIPTMPTWTPPAEATGNVVPFVKASDQ